MPPTYKPHPLAELFPVMPAAEMTSLLKSIKKSGLLSPITLFEGKILDGRHRFEACELAGVEPRFVEFDGDDPVAFVLAANLERRHLSVSERAAIAAELANMKHGGDRKSEKAKQDRNSQLARKEAAKSLGVSRDSVDVAAKVKAEDPAMFEKIKAGEITVHAAEKKLAERAEKRDSPGAEVDKTGWPIPPDLLPLWLRRRDVLDAARAISNVKVAIEKGLADEDPIWRGLRNDAVMAAQALYASIKLAAPFAVCPKCQGKLQKKCDSCKGVGLVTEFFWNQCVPKEDKAMREKKLKKD